MKVFINLLILFSLFFSVSGYSADYHYPEFNHLSVSQLEELARNGGRRYQSKAQLALSVFYFQIKDNERDLDRALTWALVAHKSGIDHFGDFHIQSLSFDAYSSEEWVKVIESDMWFWTREKRVRAAYKAAEELYKEIYN